MLPKLDIQQAGNRADDNNYSVKYTVCLLNIATVYITCVSKDYWLKQLGSKL